MKTTSVEDTTKEDADTAYQTDIMKDIIEKQQAVTLKEVKHTSDASMKSKLLEEYGDVSASDEEELVDIFCIC